MTAERLKKLAHECGFELAGICTAQPSPDNQRYREWVAQGMAGEMRYLTDHRAELRMDPRSLLPSAKSVLSVGKLYNTPKAYSTELSDSTRGWISRYAWGDDYHHILKRDLERVAALLPPGTECRVCVDTAPLLERSYARSAGLGWIGKNTCLINQPLGSWFFLGELLTSLELEPDNPPPDRCGTCTRCIDACPTHAILPDGYTLDARLCISYFTIELREAIPETLREPAGAHIFGCDICQDVCPWNRRAPLTNESGFEPRLMAPPLTEMASISEDQFRAMFRTTPVSRAKYAGFLRNVAVAMGNSRRPEFREPLHNLASYPNPLIQEHARWALERLG